MARSTLYLKRRSLVMPAPTSIVNGKALGPSGGPWVPTTRGTPTNWATPKLTAGAKGASPTDVTFFRDKPTEILAWSSRDPMGDALATFRFPRVSPFDTLGSGSLAFVADGIQYNLQAVTPAPATLTLFEGLLDSIEFDDDDALIVTCKGANYQVDDFIRAPGVEDASYDIGAGIQSNFDPSAGVRPSLHTSALTITGGTSSTAIGITSRKRGAWERVLSFLDELQAETVYNSGADQWTILLNRPRQPNLRVRDRTTAHYTVTFGQPGFTLRPSQDYAEAFNVIYGAGVDSAGGEWRNIYINASTGAVFWQPLAYDDLVHGLDEDGNGGLTDNSARTNSAIRRRELFINFGEGWSKADASVFAEQLRLRLSDPGWLAEAELSADPENESRHVVKAGENIKVKQFAGSGTTGTLFHIGEADHNGFASVRMTLDTKARPISVIEKLLERARDPLSPALSLRLGRDSALIRDKSRCPWDDENGAGYYPRERKFTGTDTVSLTANTWNIRKIVAADGPETIAKSEFYAASSSATFAIAVMDWNIGSGSLPTNPLTTATDWSAALPGCLMAWGRQGQRGGYSDPTGAVDGLESAGDPKTGKLLDSAPWTITHDRGTATGSGDASNAGSPAFLWVAVFCDTTTTMYGRLWKGPGN